MIEIELKYELKKDIPSSLKPTNQKIVEDIYYDTEDYKLLKNGNFLRLRNKKQFDFKLKSNDDTHLYCEETNYDYTEENVSKIVEVLNRLGVNISSTNLIDLTNDLKVLAPIKKKRTTYQLEENVVMVIDEVEDLGTYLEIEYDLDSDTLTEEDSIKYKNYLNEVLEQNGITKDHLEYVSIGYVELYLKKYNNEAYQLGLYQD